MQKFRLEEMEIEEVGSFVYLGSVVLESRGTEEDVASRIKKANGVFVQLYSVWRNLNISKEVKLRIFNTNVKSVSLISHHYVSYHSNSDVGMFGYVIVK